MKADEAVEATKEAAADAVDQAEEAAEEVKEAAADAAEDAKEMADRVGVIRDGRLDFFSGHGVADIASGAPIAADTVFRIASITKTFTAVAVMQLVERSWPDAPGRMDGFDWPITRKEALHALRSGAHAEEAGDVQAKGNGSLMRILPLPLVFRVAQPAGGPFGFGGQFQQIRQRRAGLVPHRQGGGVRTASHTGLLSVSVSWRASSTMPWYPS